jgi:YjbE family integral membrane protein
MLDAFSSTAQYLIPLAEIVGINIVLSGDNAVVIAMAASTLPVGQQKKAIVWGSGAAIVMRILLTLTAVALLSVPYLKLVGSVVLIWIGIRLLDADASNDEGEIKSGASLLAAIRTILFADVVMSLDNVLGVAAAAEGNIPLLIIGLGLSIPVVIFGANVLLRLMQRFPVIITLGAVLIGYVGGEMAVSDPAISGWVDLNFHALQAIVPIACGALVLLVGKFLGARKKTA